eukprot:scaffold7538_cov430-Prasinococcus_capsulatus_cf.AAC.2
MITFLNEISLFVSKALVTTSAIIFDFATSLPRFQMPRYYGNMRRAYKYRQPSDQGQQDGLSSTRKRGAREVNSSRFNALVQSTPANNWSGATSMDNGDRGEMGGPGLPGDRQGSNKQTQDHDMILERKSKLLFEQRRLERTESVEVTDRSAGAEDDELDLTDSARLSSIQRSIEKERRKGRWLTSMSLERQRERRLTLRQRVLELLRMESGSEFVTDPSQETDTIRENRLYQSAREDLNDSSLHYMNAHRGLSPTPHSSKDDLHSMMLLSNDMEMDAVGSWHLHLASIINLCGFHLRRAVLRMS